MRTRKKWNSCRLLIAVYFEMSRKLLLLSTDFFLTKILNIVTFTKSIATFFLVNGRKKMTFVQ